MMRARTKLTKLLLSSSWSLLNILKNLSPSPHHNKRWEKVLYPSGPIIIPRQSCRHPTWGGASVPAQHPLTRQNKTINNTVGPNICWCFKARQSLRLATITLLCLLSPLPTTTILVNDHHSHINITTMVTNALLIGTITSLKHTRSSFSRVSSPSLQTKYFRSSHTIFKLHLSARFALQVVNFVQRQILHNQVHRRINIRCLWNSGIGRKK